MHARERVIREHFAAHACPRCARLQAQASMLVLARRHDTWMVLVTCPACDHRGIYLAAFPPAPGRAAAVPWASDGTSDVGTIEVRPLTPANLAAGLVGTAPHDASAVTHDDVQAMRQFLQSFDGNFRRVFADS